MKARLIPILMLLAACGSSEEPAGKVYEKNGIAIDGYDPVAYFEQSEATLGSIDYTSTYEGLTYQFSSSENKSLFDEEPQSYIPSYGGWCAYAIAETSTKMEPDPTMWKIQEGELLLFYDDWMTSLTGSLKEEWETDEGEFKTRADGNWETVKSR